MENYTALVEYVKSLQHKTEALIEEARRRIVCGALHSLETLCDMIDFHLGLLAKVRDYLLVRCVADDAVTLH